MAADRVVHEDDLPWEESREGAFFARRRRRLGNAAGGRRLGCSLVELAPGHTAWPFHYHCGNEEAIYVLAGVATLRLPNERVRVRAGDYIALPAGSEHAHQLTNTGSEPVRYLVISTMRDPDVVVYPDSDKVGAFAGAAPGADGTRDVFAFFPKGAAVDVWHGEPTGAAGTDAAATPGRSPDEKRDAATIAAEAAERERRIDEEIAEMKQRLKTQPDARVASPAAPAPHDDIDALKRKLDEG